jgi:hypothetical protein
MRNFAGYGRSANRFNSEHRIFQLRFVQSRLVPFNVKQPGQFCYAGHITDRSALPARSLGWKQHTEVIDSKVMFSKKMRTRSPGSAFLLSNWFSLIGKRQIVQINVVSRLLVVPIHLEIDRNAPPTGIAAARAVGPVQSVGYTVERDRLVRQLIA